MSRQRRHAETGSAAERISAYSSKIRRFQSSSSSVASGISVVSALAADRFAASASGSRRAREPGRPAAVDVVDLAAGQAGHVRLHREADPRLEVGEVPIPRRVAFEQLAGELEGRGRVDGVEAVLLVDGLSLDDAPAAVAPFDEVVEAPRADHVAGDPVHRRTLRDRHLRLGAPAVAGDVDRRAAEEVEDADAALEACAARGDELRGGALEPGRVHLPGRVPDGGEPLPVAGVAVDGPVLDDLPDREAVGGPGVHDAGSYWRAAA